MSRNRIVAACVVAFAAGALSMFTLLRFQHVSSDWFELVKSDSPLTFSTEVVFKSDIALPDAKQMSGTAKFLSDNEQQKLGYLVHLDVPPLDRKKLPEKYLKERPSEVEGVKTARSCGFHTEPSRTIGTRC